MKEQVYIRDIAQYDGKEVLLAGWLYNKTHKGKLYFLQIRDGSGIIQGVVFKPDVSPEVFELCETLTQESSIKVTGTVRADSRAPSGFELQIKNVELVHLAQEYPISPKEHGVEFLMDHRDLWLRSARQVAIMHIRHELVRAIRDYFDSHGFVLVDAPIFTPNACEGTSTLFETEYFGQKAYLTQSGQLYMEPAAMALGKVYCFGPTFRAEKSKTRRHLTEFWMVEPEVAYMNLDQDMDLAEDFLVYIISRILETRREDLKRLERELAPLERVQKPFPRIRYNEAVKIIQESGQDFQFGDDFGAADETLISEHFDRPVMVHRYPTEVKAFYMKSDPEDATRALCVDVLAPEGYGEIIGGGQREDDYETLLAKIKGHNLPIEAFNWYLDVRRYGSVPHAGFGLGLERTLTWICKLSHLRETIPFPRLIHRLTP